MREAANATIIGARYVNNGMLNPSPRILPLIVRSSRLGIDMSGWIGPARVNEHTELNLWLGAQTHNTSIILLARGVDGLTTNLSARWRQFLERWVPAFLGLKFVFQYSSVAVDPASVAHILPRPRQRGRILRRCALAGNTNTRCRPRCSGAVADIPAFRFSKDEPHRRVRPRTKFSPPADFPHTLPF